METAADGARPARKWRKRLLVMGASLLATLALLELVARVGAWLYYGRNPYYLYYGFVSWTDDSGEGHSEKRDGYFKFQPNDTIEHGLPAPGRINNHGFRGADFATEKPAGVHRIVCLGGSSTFGYKARDEATYPALLQQRFAASPGGAHVEVINGGIPHFNTGHIAAMLEAEGLAWSPDVITLYEAYNDATWPLAENRWQVATRKLDEYSAAFACLRKLLNASLGDVVFHQWSAYLPRMTREALERQIELHRAMTRANLVRIAALAERVRARIVVVRQPMTLWYTRVEHGLAQGPRPELTYEGEVAEVRERLEREGAITGWESVLLVHSAVLEEYDAFATERALPVVDNVALVDSYPDGLETYVHLTEKANARLADALYDALAPLVGP